MAKRFSFSIKWQIFSATTITSLVALLLFAFFALPISYNEMYTQLIESRVTSMNWLSLRLNISIRFYEAQFYEYEVDKDFRGVVLSWSSGGGLDHRGQTKIRTSFDRSLAVDSYIKSIEIYNLNSGETYISTRASSYLQKDDTIRDLWNQRNNSLQTNAVFIRAGEEILVLHQMNQFETGESLALILLRMKPAVFGDYITHVKVNPGEGVLLLNDQAQLLFMDAPNIEDDYAEDPGALLRRLRENPRGPYTDNHNFFFYAAPAGAKLQVVYIVPNDSLTGTLGQTLLVGIIISLIAVILALLLSLLFSRIISGPIIQLSERMRTSTIKDYININTGSRNDEIGLLQNSFDTMIRRNQELILEEYQSKIEKRNAQIRALQAQIHPHFIHNTLQVIGGMALKKDFPGSYAMVNSLSDMLRYSFNFSRETEPLKKEIDYLDAYIAIQNNRFGGRVRFEKSVPGELMDALMPKLMLQPIFENSFEHGFSEKPGLWNLGLAVEKTGGGNILIRAYDNGVGIRAEKLAAVKSSLERSLFNGIDAAEHIGLINVNSRIRLKYGPPYGIAIDSVFGEGVTVMILMKWERDGGT
jgi:two-component system sensor histidine kinase YesM